jgi:ABC-type transport system involved in cytochrome c biogenesis ATPase subunit
VIELRNVWLRRGERRVFESLELTFSDPGLYALVGPMASGKTLLSRLVCGLCRPSKGQVVVDQQNLYDLIFRRNVATWYCDASRLEATDETVDNYMRTMVYDSGGDQRPLQDLAPRLERALEIHPRSSISTLSAGQLCALQIVLSGVMATRVVVFDGHADSLNEEAFVLAVDLLMELRTNHDSFALFTARAPLDRLVALTGQLLLEPGDPNNVNWDNADSAAEEVGLMESVVLRLQLARSVAGQAFQSGRTYKVLSVDQGDLLIERIGEFQAVLAELTRNGIAITGATATSYSASLASGISSISA